MGNAALVGFQRVFIKREKSVKSHLILSLENNMILCLPKLPFAFLLRPFEMPHEMVALCLVSIREHVLLPTRAHVIYCGDFLANWWGLVKREPKRELWKGSAVWCGALRSGIAFCSLNEAPCARTHELHTRKHTGTVCLLSDGGGRAVACHWSPSPGSLSCRLIFFASQHLASTS